MLIKVLRQRGVCMFEQIKEEIKADYFQQNFPNDGQRFVAWYLRNIHLRDMNETRDYITDGADDKQIDAIVIQKNVRQSLGLNNAVNKGIKGTIYGDKHRDFFFFHNGVTAICNQMRLSNSKLELRGLSVVNGCQSLNTILSCSERVKTLDDTYVLFRFLRNPAARQG